VGQFHGRKMGLLGGGVTCKFRDKTQMTSPRTNGTTSVNTYLQVDGVSRKLVATQNIKDCVIDINVYRYVQIKEYIKLQRRKYLDATCINMNAIMTINKKQIDYISIYDFETFRFDGFRKKISKFFHLTWWDSYIACKLIFTEPWSEKTYKRINKILFRFHDECIFQFPECDFIHDGKSKKHNIRRIRKIYPLLNYETIRRIKKTCPNL